MHVPLAHIAGLPAEELIPIIYGPAGLLVAGRMALAKYRIRRRGTRRQA